MRFRTQFSIFFFSSYVKSSKHICGTQERNNRMKTHSSLNVSPTLGSGSFIYGQNAYKSIWPQQPFLAMGSSTHERRQGYPGFPFSVLQCPWKSLGSRKKSDTSVFCDMYQEVCLIHRNWRWGYLWLFKESKLTSKLAWRKPLIF